MQLWAALCGVIGCAEGAYNGRSWPIRRQPVSVAASGRPGPHATLVPPPARVAPPSNPSNGPPPAKTQVATCNPSAERWCQVTWREAPLPPNPKKAGGITPGFGDEHGTIDPPDRMLHVRWQGQARHSKGGLGELVQCSECTVCGRAVDHARCLPAAAGKASSRDGSSEFSGRAEWLSTCLKMPSRKNIFLPEPLRPPRLVVFRQPQGTLRPCPAHLAAC